MIESPRTRDEETASPAKSLGTKWIAAGGIVCFLLMVAVIWRQGENLAIASTDTTSYADIAKNVRAGNLRALTNPYWSPLYPALLALLLPAQLTIEALRNAFMELQYAMHVLYIAALLYFAVGISKFGRFQERWMAAAVFAASLFFGMALYLKYAAEYAPDLLVAPTAVLALGIISRLLAGKDDWRLSAGLGIVLGISYWAKAFMFPAALVLIVVFAAVQWKKALLAAVVFLVTCAPGIVLASMGAGKPTFGESGKLNFAWNVNNYTNHRGWLGREPGSGTPLHPPRVMMERPLVLEFADPGHGTLPVWYEPARWHQGIRLRISAPEIAGSIVKNVVTNPIILLCLAISMPALLVGGWKSFAVGPGKAYYLCFFLWPLLVLAAYAIVALELRYAVPSLVSFTAAALWMCPTDTKLGRRTLAVQLILVCLVSAWLLDKPLIKPQRDTDWNEEIAANHYLAAHGVTRGDKLADVVFIHGSLLFLIPMDVQVVSWLRLSNLQEVDPKDWPHILEIWRTLHIKAAVCLPTLPGHGSSARDVPAWMGFQQIPGSQYWVKMLDQ
jgi:hypothetical protein